MRLDRTQPSSRRRTVTLAISAGSVLAAALGWFVARDLPDHRSTPAAGAPATRPAQPSPGSPPATSPSHTPPLPSATGTGLTSSGSIVVRDSGETIQGLYIQGTITIVDGVANTTIRNDVVTDDTPGYLITNDGTNLTVENSRLIGTGYPAPRDAIRPGEGRFVLVQCEISGVRNGVDLHGDSLVEGTYIHGLVHNPASHNEDLYIGSGSNIQILHNTLVNELPQTATIFIKTDFGPISDVVIQGNVLAGGGYAIYGGDRGPHGSATSIRVLSNVFSRQVAAKGGKFGLRAYWPTDAASQWLGNTWSDHSPA